MLKEVGGSLSRNAKGQSSFEYIALVAMVLIFVVAGVGIIYSHSKGQTDDVQMRSIESIGRDIINSVEKVYYIGGDSWETLKVNVPNNVRDMYILNNNELVIEFESYNGVNEAVFFSDINITTPYVSGSTANLSGFFHPGNNMFKVTSQGANVSIEEVA